MKVLVLNASALHLGFVGCYGNTWIATPQLDRLAAEGVVFDQHFADNLNERTCFTGCYGWTSAPAMPELPAILSKASVSFAHVRPAQPLPGSDATPLESTLETAVAALADLDKTRRWLCWVDLPSLYPPWDVADEFTLPYLSTPDEDDEGQEEDEPFAALPDPAVGPLDLDDLVLWERLRCTYAGAVAYLDAGLGLLFEELKKQQNFDELTIVFTADRGLALGEHGIVGDWLPWLHDEVVHLPLIVRQPKSTGAGMRISALTQPVDLAATLLELFGVGMSELDGKNWLPLLGGEVDEFRQHAISAWQLGPVKEWSVRTSDCALIVPGPQPGQAPGRPTQLFLKPEDRWEINNVIQHHLELAEELERLGGTP